MKAKRSTRSGYQGDVQSQPRSCIPSRLHYAGTAVLHAGVSMSCMMLAGKQRKAVPLGLQPLASSAGGRVRRPRAAQRAQCRLARFQLRAYRCLDPGKLPAQPRHLFREAGLQV